MRPRTADAASFLAVAAGLLAVAAAVTAITVAPVHGHQPQPRTHTSSAKTPTAAPATCRAQRGTATTALDAAHAKLLNELRTGLKSVPATVCARTPVASFGVALVQQLVGIRYGAVFVPSNGAALLLTRAQWDSYRQIGGKDGRQVPLLVGPLRAVTVGSGYSELIAKNGLLLGAGPEEPHSGCRRRS